MEVDRRAMLTVSHAMTFETHWHKEGVEISEWFKHPHSTDDYWWQIAAEIQNQEATMSIMVEKESRISTSRSSRILPTSFVVCSLELKVFKKFIGHQKMNKYLLPETMSYGVYKVPATRRRFKILRLRFGKTPTELTVVVSITLLHDPRMIEKMNLYSTKPSMDTLSLVLNLEPQIIQTFLGQQDCSDLDLHMRGGQIVRTHKGILMASSPVFRAMFMHDTLEKRDNKIIIPDLSAKAITEALCFLSSGEVNLDDVDLVRELVELSERYDLLALKIRCECALINSLYGEDGKCVASVPNYAVDLLDFANMYRMKTLKEACEVTLSWHIRDHSIAYFKLALDTSSDFLRKFAFERLIVLRHPYFDEDGWKELAEKYPQEVQELLIAQIKSHGSSPGMIKLHDHGLDRF